MRKPEQAGSADLDGILHFFDGVQVWLVSRGLTGQWGDTPFSSSPAQGARFATWIASGEFYVVREKSGIAATLVLGTRPPSYAAAAGKPMGGYLEAFAVRRDKGGQGLGAGILEWAEREMRQRGYNTLRLDCWAGNEALRAYYRRAGFREVARFEVGSWRGVLFEKRLKFPP